MRAGPFLQQTKRGPNMRDVAGLLVSLLTFVVGRGGDIAPCRVLCSGTRCFTVLHHATDFTAAQDRCGDLGGHLMTVQSSSVQSLLPTLLKNLTGRFWIGLHLATSCPEPAAELRGFDWVTGEVRSEFSHWSSDFDGNCLSPRCVSVSQEDDFEWVQVLCAGTLSGFLCEHGLGDPCQPLTDAQGESVTYTPPGGGAGEAARSLPPGSIAVRMSDETKYFCLVGKWQPAPRSCDTHEGPSGETPDPRNNVPYPATGTDDPCLALDCAQGCYKNRQHSACTCAPGFELAQDGRSCVDIDSCGDERRCAGKNLVCVNSVGGGSQCACQDGYVSHSGQCVDVDECASAPCEHMCVNTPGSYECSCYHGYKKDAHDPHTCALFCGKEECAAECDPNNRFQCYCPDGYVADERGGGTVCMDIDECSSDYCDHRCQNTFGSYVCTCLPGYTLLDQFRCVEKEGGGDEEPEGSAEATSPSFPTTPAAARPGPTRRPSASGVSAGGLAGIIVGTVVFILLVLFVAHRILGRRRRMESGGALKAAQDAAGGAGFKVKV
ncbi:thrombomodulin-like [Spinachia spinachia]